MPRGRRFRHWSDVVGWVGREAACGKEAADTIAAELFAAGWDARGRDTIDRLASVLGGNLHNAVDPRHPDLWAPANVTIT